MTSFRLGEHAIHGKAVVEVWQDGEFIAAIYATEDGVKLVSKYVVTADLHTPEPDQVTELVVSIHT